MAFRLAYRPSRLGVKSMRTLRIAAEPARCSRSPGARTARCGIGVLSAGSAVATTGAARATATERDSRSSSAACDRDHVGADRNRRRAASATR